MGQASGNGDGRAITLHQADLCFPDQKLTQLASWSAQAAGEVALQQWGWALARDPEGVRHWQPRARGVSSESEPGYRFRGRTAALTQIVQWLDRPGPDRQVLVVTGSPGVGKSAVLGRIVTTADVAIRASLPPRDAAVKASPGSVNCAVHVKGKTAQEVAEEIARAASAKLPEHPDALAPAVRDVLSEQAARKFNVIIDALDEAASPEQARVIIHKLVLPLVNTCSDVGAQVVVGTRRRDDGGELLGLFGGALVTLDLDVPGYFAEEDLAAYAQACLQLSGDERPGNPYADDALAAGLAARIAAMSGRNFLVAGLTARSHGLHDEQAIDPGQLEFAATVNMALAAYLKRLNPVGGLSAADALTALAFAEAPGLPVELWQLAIEAINGKSVDTAELTRFARSSAANFLVEVGGGAGSVAGAVGLTTVYRLFHQALNDALLRERSDVVPRASDERALTLAFIERGRAGGWENVPGYLLRSLPGHAGAAGLVDDLLRDDAYLLHADLRRLLQVAHRADSAAGHGRAQLLRLTPRAITAEPRDRAALFSVTEALDGLGTAYRDPGWRGPYRAVWASAKPRRDQHAVLEGHQGAVRAVCPVDVSGRQLLASAGVDGTVRIWDPGTGEQPIVLEAHQGPVNGLCPVTLDGRQLLASASDDHTVALWDPGTGEQRMVLEGHRKTVNAVCQVTVDGRQLLASASDDRTVRLWDLGTGEQRLVLKGHKGNIANGGVRAICALTANGRQLLASTGADRTVRLWDPGTGEQRTVLRAEFGWLNAANALSMVTVDGAPLLAAGGDDFTVRILDLGTGEERVVLRGHRAGGTAKGVNGLCTVTTAGRQVLASAGEDCTVRIWDPGTGEQQAILEGHQGGVHGVCPVVVDGRQMLASASKDGRVQIWDLGASGQREVSEGHQDRINGVCPVTVDGLDLLATASDDGTARIWDPRTGDARTVFAGQQGRVNGVCPVTVDGLQLLATAGSDSTVRIWDPRTGDQRSVLRGHKNRSDGVNAVCAVTVDGRPLLATAGDDRTVRIWDPATGDQRSVLKSDTKWLGGAKAVCTLAIADRELLASAGDDGTVRIWDPATGDQQAVLNGHRGPVNGVCPVKVAGRQLLASAGNDCTVRIWDPGTGTGLLTIPTYYIAMAVEEVSGSLAVGLRAGILVIRLDIDA
ncbi:MAG: AAA family ATPase [Streptosporangiaceae bacterium]